MVDNSGIQRMSVLGWSMGGDEIIAFTRVATVRVAFEAVT
jgi:hypothetical protein